MFTKKIHWNDELEITKHRALPGGEGWSGGDREKKDNSLHISLNTILTS